VAKLAALFPDEQATLTDARLRRFERTTCGAAYLEPAVRRDAPLVTTDTELVRAALELGVVVAA